MSDNNNITFDLNGLEDDLLETSSNFDLNSLAASNEAFGSETDSINQLNFSQHPLTLESILNEEDDFENDQIIRDYQSSLKNATKIDSLNNSKSQASLTSLACSSLIEKNGSVCKQACLKQISTQLVNAIERSDSGLPTALAVSQLIAIGTSRGLVLLFDSCQVLKLYITTEFKDAITALSFNNKCDRLLVGNAMGYIFMFDATTGKCLRQITDAHPSGNAILNLKFTDDLKIACFSDSGGSVFMLEFKRVMGVRGANSTCLFSGSRGEVCHIEPLKFDKFSETIMDKLAANSESVPGIRKNLNNIQSLFNKYTLLAMASFTKVYVVTLKPSLTVLFTYPLAGSLQYLPILSWHLVIVQKADASGKSLSNRFVSPILACARESTIHFFQVDYSQAKYKESNKLDGQTGSGNDLAVRFNFRQLPKCEFKFKILNFSWLNAKTLAILDDAEKVHICDIRSNQVLQVLTNLSTIQLVYNSCFFKSLATGGYVSKAFSFAGENACYNTIQTYLGQLFMLGSQSIVLFSLQNWSSRIDDFINYNNLDLALDLALAMYKGIYFFHAASFLHQILLQIQRFPRIFQS